MNKQRDLTKTFFDEVAAVWAGVAYDPQLQYDEFPMGRVRQDVTVAEMQRLGVGKRTIDVGCGTGQFVAELLRLGYDSRGFDVSANMVAQAKRHAASVLAHADTDSRYFVGDVHSFRSEVQYDVVTAMGVLEYIESDREFLETVTALLKPGGFAFIECRNRLFNAATANRYTLEAAQSGDLASLVPQLDQAGRYSPSTITAAQALRQVLREVSDALATQESAPEENRGSQLKDYPAQMARRQHTPAELSFALEAVGLTLVHVVYYHFHPFPPRYEHLMPRLYNRLACAMQPLGYTPLGAATCSAFVAVIQKGS